MSVISLGCFAFVIVKMFQEGDSTIGILCLIGLIVCGLGGLVAFVYGWMKVRQWDLMPVMAVWTGAIVLTVLARVGAAVLAGG